MATGSDYPLGAAITTVRAGMSARAGLAAFRLGGGRTGDAKWFRMVAEARRTLADSIEEAGRPLNRRPTGDEITVVSSQRRSGFWQQVEVFYRDRATNEVSSAPFVLRSAGLVTRQAAVAFALGEWEAGSAGSPNPDDHEVLGAAYTSTLELQPAASPPVPTVTQATMPRPAPTPTTPQSAVRATLAGLRGGPGLPGPPGAPAPYSTVREAMREGGYVSIADLRASMPELSRSDFDAAIHALARDPNYVVIPEAYQLALRGIDRVDGVVIGGQMNHWVKWLGGAVS